MDHRIEELVRAEVQIRLLEADQARRTRPRGRRSERRGRRIRHR